MRRPAPALLTALGLAATAVIALAGTASATGVTEIAPGTCVAGGGRVIALPAPHPYKCIGGTYDGSWVTPPAP